MYFVMCKGASSVQVGEDLGIDGGRESQLKGHRLYKKLVRRSERVLGHRRSRWHLGECWFRRPCSRWRVSQSQDSKRVGEQCILSSTAVWLQCKYIRAGTYLQPEREFC